MRIQKCSPITSFAPKIEASVDFDDPHEEIGSCDISESISRTLCVLVILATMFSGQETLFTVLKRGYLKTPYIGSSRVLRRWNKQFNP